ncbi:hypothetical protein CLOSTHATH_04335 [Hungatella hathewayi DSM 13479]|uniref:Uncharacterized protein n=1 Tax=Hungatella hathewayi DSM 13479 TaxID=566550 RepID=D3AL41_9FIRM|nr:hypothetical protein CLOSTHATH_04335 [Hungatella hathewayi DSM 13479]
MCCACSVSGVLFLTSPEPHSPGTVTHVRKVHQRRRDLFIAFCFFICYTCFTNFH